MTPAITLISANAIARAGLSRILVAEGFVVSRSVATADELALDQADAGLVIVDETSAEVQLDTVRALTAASPGVRLVVLSPQFDFETMVECFSAGAEGYLIKDMGVPALVGSLQLIAGGQKVMPSALADQLPLRPGPTPGPQSRQALEEAHLSPREHETLCCLVAGHSNKAVARQLDVSEATIKVHIKAILRKLKVANRTQAAIWAVEQGIDMTMPDQHGEKVAERIAA